MGFFSHLRKTGVSKNIVIYIYIYITESKHGNVNSIGLTDLKLGVV